MSEKTVFIIGAGASTEAKLPTGVQLKRKISLLLDFPIDIYEEKPDANNQIIKAFQKSDEYFNNPNFSFLKEAELIKEALPLAISIDNFLHDHKNNANVIALGKLAIVKSILEAENESLLNFNRSNKKLSLFFTLLEQTWYSPFFKIITENCSKEDLKERFSLITLIIFNYDRCIEHFLFNAIKLYYNITDSEASKIINHLTIFHPYGTVGRLPWADLPTKKLNEIIEFGGEPDPVKLDHLASQIKTFTESTNWRSKTIYNMHYKIKSASRLVFLGFAFHKLNMQLITPKNYSHIESENTTSCFATAHKISKSDGEDIKSQITLLGAIPQAINLADLECKDFFNHFWRSLSF